jgi:RHS repeat-associated protein
VQAAKEKTLSGGEALPQAGTRVWGLPSGNRNGAGGSWPLTSTLAWGWQQFYGGTASDQLVQRYYSSIMGRFLTADRYMAAARGANDPSSPQSWNRYGYGQGDPINHIDPHGLFTCDPNNLGCYPGCDPNDDLDCVGLPDPERCDALFGGGCGGGGGAPPPKPQPPPAPPGPSCEDLLVDAINGFLVQHAPSLASYASAMEVVGASDNIDPRLIAAIAVAENGQATNNPYALGPNGRNTYTSITAATNAVGKQLDKYIYTWNETSVAALWSGNIWIVKPGKPWITVQPPAYCTGLNAKDVAACQNTGSTISTFMQSMGGDPNKLGFPCND